MLRVYFITSLKSLMFGLSEPSVVVSHDLVVGRSVGDLRHGDGSLIAPARAPEKFIFILCIFTVNSQVVRFGDDLTEVCAEDLDEGAGEEEEREEEEEEEEAQSRPDRVDGSHYVEAEVGVGRVVDVAEDCRPANVILYGGNDQRYLGVDSADETIDCSVHEHSH